MSWLVKCVTLRNILALFAKFYYLTKCLGSLFAKLCTVYMIFAHPSWGTQGNLLQRLVSKALSKDA